MTAIIILLFLLMLLYVLQISWFIWGILQLKKSRLKEAKPLTEFSVIIPFRNEAANLPDLLISLKHLKYPTELYEIIFVDDASEDDSVAIIQSFLRVQNKENYRIIPNERKTLSPKKDAIHTAITISKMAWILTTDADCTVPENWLKKYDAIIRQEKPVCVAGPVLLKPEDSNSLVEQFQLLDSLSLSGVTMGTFGLGNPILCNGANLAYKKATFQELKGFRGNENIASGDDIFMLEKIQAAFPQKVKFLFSKEATVTTKPETRWKAVFQQRIRWAAKSAAYKSGLSKAIGLLTLLANGLLLLAILLMVFAKMPWYIFLLLFGLKAATDFFLIRESGRFFGVSVRFPYYLAGSIFYPLATVYISFRALYGGYTWKGRKFKK